MPAPPGDAPGGLTPKEANEAVYLLGRNQKVMALDIVEVDPMKDVKGVTCRMAVMLMVSFLVGLTERRAIVDIFRTDILLRRWVGHDASPSATGASRLASASLSVKRAATGRVTMPARSSGERRTKSFSVVINWAS